MFLIVFSLIAVRNLGAEDFYLANGNMISGQIIEETPISYIVLSESHGRILMDKSFVR